MSRQIAVGENWPSMCIKTHFLSKQTVIQSCGGVPSYICWECGIQTDDVDGILKHDSHVNCLLRFSAMALRPWGPRTEEGRVRHWKSGVL